FFSLAPSPTSSFTLSLHDALPILFLGRYLGWVSMYLLVLYIGYTQLPTGLRGVSDWLSPVFGIHFNTLIVAAHLVFTNPLTNPRSEEHTSELQSRFDLVCRLLLEK